MHKLSAGELQDADWGYQYTEISLEREYTFTRVVFENCTFVMHECNVTFTDCVLDHCVFHGYGVINVSSN